MTLLTDDEMPALPKGAGAWTNDPDHAWSRPGDPMRRWTGEYTAEQMRAHGRAVEARVREKMGAQPASAEQQPVAWFSPEQMRAMTIVQAAAKALEEGTFTTPPAEAVSYAARDVLAERRRQVEAEGWTPAHDDAHDDGELAEAAAAYALDNGWAGAPPPSWPWSAAWWKPKDRRSNLVRAAALLLAEIERLDRAAAKGER